MHFVAVLNGESGQLRTTDLAAFVERAIATFADAGHSLDCRVVNGSDLIEELGRAIADPACDAIIAGGGDGTVSAAAEMCFRSGKTLAVLPAGTMNLFARSLGMPLDLEQAVESIANGEATAADIATANGRPFVHQYAVGMHSRLVAIRNGLPYASRLGKMLASLRAVAEAVRRPLRFDAAIRWRDHLETRRAMAISVSNNPLADGHLPYAETIDSGALGVYLVRPIGGLALLGLLAQLMFGRWKSHPMVSEREVERLTLTFPRLKRNAKAVIDGELIPLPRTVELIIHPRALRVIRPVLAAPQIPAEAEKQKGPA